uniref:Uncharacterized protein n=1 Tax=Lepeophtheirus salmonis TaxID=72036 RepID=A0A0K2UR58_LEPSM
MTSATVDRCTFFFLVDSDIFIVGLTLKASTMSSGFTSVGLPLLGLSPSAKQFLTRPNVALLTFTASMMSEVVLPARITLPMMTLLASIATYI